MTFEEDRQLETAEYWDSRYVTSNSNEPTHEWIRSFEHLIPFLSKHLLEQPGRTANDNPKILHLGSGDSTVPAELAERGYRRQLCVDFSPVVTKMMTERHKNIEGIEWSQVDARSMLSIDTGSVDVAFDKSTLDAMIYGSPWDPPDDVRENTTKYLKEVT
ncbi:endothelin-converting enzyme 2 [Fusarium heterosporum]|uniref:Endothelin-converting enzyme 2 n=1 Tax=Fusarium heterosporum TaxID=42747 RepID=A0A8H5TCJ6_FUSHE|nr:endothelin-converting enzyme 2 [Fusarium heterosporum]